MPTILALLLGFLLGVSAWEITSGQPYMFYACMQEKDSYSGCRELLHARLQPDLGRLPMPTQWEDKYVKR
jgi:hypothetical protein